MENRVFVKVEGYVFIPVNIGIYAIKKEFGYVQWPAVKQTPDPDPVYRNAVNLDIEPVILEFLLRCKFFPVKFWLHFKARERK
jgi:hypothetical protein